MSNISSDSRDSLMKIRSCSPWSDLISDSVCQENAEECEDSLSKPFALKICHRSLILIVCTMKQFSFMIQTRFTCDDFTWNRTTGTLRWSWRDNDEEDAFGGLSACPHGRRLRVCPEPGRTAAASQSAPALLSHR